MNENFIFQSVEEILKCGVAMQMKTIEQYFSVRLFYIMLYNVGLWIKY